MKLQNQYSIGAGKLQARTLSYYYHLAYVSSDNDHYAVRANRTYHCSDIVSGYYCPSCGAIAHWVTYGCQDRLCPICATKQSHVAAYQARTVYAAIKQDKPSIHASLLTLTVRNCCQTELSPTVSALIDAWSHFTKTRWFARCFVGWARALEITYNNRDNTYHPHLHIIVLHTGIAPSASNIASVWRVALDADYSPVVDIRRARNNRALSEISKYVCKSSSLLSHADVAYAVPVITIEDAIYGRRLRSWGGIWAKYRKRLALVSDEAMTEPEINAELAKIDDHSPLTCDCGADMIYGSLWWAGFASRYYFKKLDGGPLF